MRVDLANRQRRHRLSSLVQPFIIWLTDLMLPSETDWSHISIVLVGDRLSAELNQSFLAHPGPTDVITFTYPQPTGSRHGEIIVNLDAALGESLARNLSPSRELARYLIHGFLHLQGLEDNTPEQRKRMRNHENRWLARADRAGFTQNLVKPPSP
ncbi:MAG TPA: rRNA maturation RNase YbeY [Kiritimatiellia bacterium]|nr:rRNA maturation RNase YbeY [Kiritimatiellia bacterium]